MGAGAIEDATHIWWALRPSEHYPTLELRVTDACTSVDDAVSIASLYRAIVHHLVRVPQTNSSYSALDRALTQENHWRAQRYGTDGTYIDLASRKAIPFAELLARILEQLRPDFALLGMQSEIPRLCAIQKRGTSAHRQLALYDRVHAAGYLTPAAPSQRSKWLRFSTEAGQLLDHGSFVASISRRRKMEEGKGLREGLLPLSRNGTTGPLAHSPLR